MIASTYLYVWNDTQHCSIVASGLQFTDFEPLLRGKSGLLLLRHHFEGARRNIKSGLDYIEVERIQLLAKSDIYSWGDFYWADYSVPDLAHLTADEVSELSYFATEALPKKAPRINSLGNDFLVAAHDDGWYIRAFYSDWDFMAQVIQRRAPELTIKDLDSLRVGTSGFWINSGEVRTEEMTFDVDVVINRNLKRLK